VSVLKFPRSELFFSLLNSLIKSCASIDYPRLVPPPRDCPRVIHVDVAPLRFFSDFFVASPANAASIGSAGAGVAGGAFGFF
jgi:hypothetical protein